ncbi:MAG: hypothetical protein ACPLVF_11180 [Thermovenabulum sp.]|uniref:hypothetical protein n=1 Tax=Thermovenabulum sp. TaxID=3100335 RepID=UPI003C7D050A
MRWPVNQQKLKKVVQTKLEKNYRAEYIEKWLRVSLLALKGPFAGSPWVKYFLKELTHINPFAII